MVAAVVVFFFFFFFTTARTAGCSNAAVVEHTFVVSQVRMRHLCKDTLVTVVNGQFPGPVIEVTEGDSIAVHVVNKSPYGITIHWHGVKQRLNCWNDGVGMITQCPIQPNKNFTYRFNVAGQEGTLWWHAHVSCLRATVHGALVIRPRSGASSYPFPRPDGEFPVVVGEWWETDLALVDRHLLNSSFDDYPVAAAINGKLGDLYNCSGAMEENYIMDMQYGKTYLLRIVNAALYSEYYLKIAGHKFMVVAADANYVRPYTTDIIAVAPGETVDALVVADAPPGRYYMVAQPNQPPKPDTQTPVFISRGVVQYCNPDSAVATSTIAPLVPEMPGQHDTITSFYFHGNLTSLPHRRQLLLVPPHVDEHLFVALGLGSLCRWSSSCNRSMAANETILLATMNNVTFELPKSASLLEAYYHGKMNRIKRLEELPDWPPRPYNFTDKELIPEGARESRLLPTSSKATVARRFRFNSTVEIVFQSTALFQSDSNPMHLHGHDFFVLAQGLGNYDAERDAKRYNLVDPPVRNTVLVPRLGWAAIRFVTNNPGVWYMHCHYEFHVSMGMAAAFLVENGPTLDTTLPSPPADFPKCYLQSNNVAYQ